MKRSANYVKPIECSLEALEDAGITSAPVDLKIILHHYRMMVRLKKYSHLIQKCGMSKNECIRLYGKDGSCVCDFRTQRYIIYYNDVGGNSRRRIRFTIAHELGHIFLGHHYEYGRNILREEQIDDDLYEILEDEANCFARNLLSPAPCASRLLEEHGFRCQYDQDRRMMAWKRIAVRDRELKTRFQPSYLVETAFGVSNRAANVRIDLLSADNRNMQLYNIVSYAIENLRLESAWHCNGCGAFRLPHSSYCIECGTKGRFGYAVKDAERYPVVVFSGTHFSACPVCGNTEYSEGSLYCRICGTPTGNPCVDFERIRNYSSEPERYKALEKSVLAREEPYSDYNAHEHDSAENGSSENDPAQDSGRTPVLDSDIVWSCFNEGHANQPYAKFCADCGRPTLLHVLGRTGRIKAKGEYKKTGEKLMKYKTEIPYDDNMRVLICPRCKNEEFSWGAMFCRICGMDLYNKCEGEPKENQFGETYYEQHDNPSNARYCETCGKPTQFFKKYKILKPYEQELREAEEPRALTFLNPDEEDNYELPFN